MSTLVRNLLIAGVVVAFLLGLCSFTIVVGNVVFGIRSPFIVTPVPGVSTVVVNPTAAAPNKDVQTLATPYPVATSAPASAPQAPQPGQPTAQPNQPSITAQGVVQKNGNIVHLSVNNPQAPDQVQTRHPAVYDQTNVSGSPITYNIDVPSGYIGIVGGFAIGGQSNGVYEALPPGGYTRVITDGFALIVRQTWAQDEWNFRLNEAKTHGWAMQKIIAGPIK